MNKTSVLLGAFVALVSATAQARGPSLPEGARYVALGSSFAAGPGVGPSKPGTPARCGRGTMNYPSLLAAKLKLDLIDATCSGATTEHILGPWNELAPQIESIDASAKLVTITIGGNDIAFVGNIAAAMCERAATTDPRCPPWRLVSEAEWLADEDRMREIVRETRRRAPEARILLVDYITVLPPKGACADLPMSDDRMKQSRAAARRLAKITARVARAESVELLKFSDLSRRHAPCSAKPWSNGMTAPGGDGIPLHPNRAGNEAAAEALAKRLG